MFPFPSDANPTVGGRHRLDPVSRDMYQPETFSLLLRPQEKAPLLLLVIKANVFLVKKIKITLPNSSGLGELLGDLRDQ